jgi:hypothetical protein
MKIFCFILALLKLFPISASLLMSQQLSKFEKWQQPNYFRGFCISAWNNLKDTYVSQSEFYELKAAGANLAIIQTEGFKSVTSPYSPNTWYSEPGYTVYWQDVLDDMVAFARNTKIQYVISVRTGPGRVDVAEDEGNSSIWKNENEQQLYGEMLKDMANRYLPDTLFVGFDLTVEPNPHDELAGEPVDDLAETLATDGINVNALYSLWISNVRTVAPDLPLMVQGIHWSNPVYFALVTKQPDNKIVYKTHCYNPYDYSHSEVPQSETYPGTFWSDALQDVVYFDKSFFMESVFSAVRSFQGIHNVPILLGEFGLSYHQYGGEKYLSDIMSIAESFGWHFSLWNWNNTQTFNYPYFDQIYNTQYMNMISEYMKSAATDVDYCKTSNQTIKNCRLFQNHPNPFNPETLITYELPLSSFVELTIYNLQGKLINRLFNNFQTFGSYQAIWDGRNLTGQQVACGIYVYRIKAGEFVSIKKMMLLR